MKFVFPSIVQIQIQSPASDPCLAYAADEVSRLLKKSHIDVRSGPPPSKSRFYNLFVGLPDTKRPTLDPFPPDLFPDAYSLSVSNHGVLIDAVTAKGILNGVYDLAERTAG